MTEQEKGILEATKEFAEIHDIPYDDRIESMILNAMREIVLNNKQNEKEHNRFIPAAHKRDYQESAG